MKIINFTKRHSLIVYFILAFMISWGLLVVLAKPGNIPINPEISGDLLPLLYVSMLIGPSVAGLLLIAIFEGRTGLGNLFSRLFRWRVNVWWYVLALFATPISAILILYVLTIFSSGFQIALSQSDGMVGLIINGVAVGIVVGMFEELGWTGFATPRMIQRFGILVSGLMIGILWGGWHYILFWEKDSYSGILPVCILIGRLFGWLPPFRILLVWLYSRTESMLLVVLTHMSLVLTTTVIVPMTLAGMNLLIWLLAWGGVLWIAAIVVNRRQSLNGQMGNRAMNQPLQQS